MGAGVTFDAWGGSWGSSWGVSWGSRQNVPSTGGGALSGPSIRPARWRPMRYRPEDRSAERITQFAKELSEQLEADAISAAKAEEIARRAERLKVLIAESAIAQDYLIAIVVALISSVKEASAMAEAADRQRQIIQAAEIAARLESDLRDEEDALILLMV